MWRGTSSNLLQRWVVGKKQSCCSMDVVTRSLATTSLQSTPKSNNTNNNQGEIITFLGLNNLSDNPGAIKKVRPH